MCICVIAGHSNGVKLFNRRPGFSLQHVWRCPQYCVDAAIDKYYSSQAPCSLRRHQGQTFCTGLWLARVET